MGALDLRDGSLRLMALRLGVAVALFVPAFVVGRMGWSEAVGGDPRFAEPEGALRVADAAYGLMNLSPAFLGLAAFAVVGCWLFDQLLLASAFRVLGAPRGEPARVWRRLWHDGWRRLLPYLRVALVGAVFAGLGVALIGRGFERLDIALQAAGETAEARLVTLNLWRVAVLIAWLSLVGAFGFWCRALLALDERARVRRVILEVSRLFLRAPFAGPLLYVVVVAPLQALGPFLLLRAGAPTPGVTDGLLWLVYGGMQIYAWHFLAHAAARTYARARFEDMRTRGDAPLGWLARLRRKKATAAR